MALEWCDGFLTIMDVDDAGEPYLIEGESQDPDFLGAIEILSFEMGSNSAFEQNDYEEADSLLSEGGVFDEPSEEDVAKPVDYREHDSCQAVIEKLFDKSSPDLFRAWCLNEGGEGLFTRCTVCLRKATGAATRDIYLTFVFDMVRVEEYKLSIGEDGVPKETIRFTFIACSMGYRPQQNDGSLGSFVKGGWDLPEQIAWTGD